MPSDSLRKDFPTSTSMNGADRNRCDIFKVASECGIRLRDPSRRGWLAARRPRECFAKRALRRIGQRHGEDHLRLVLRLIAESDGNETELYGEVITAVSAVIAGQPAHAEFSKFDRLDLGALRKLARSLNVGMPPSHVLRVLLASSLREISPT